jgi:hypothetical protein
VDEDVQLAIEDLAGFFGSGEDALRVGDITGYDVDVGMGLGDFIKGGRVGASDDGEDGVGRIFRELSNEFTAKAFGGSGDGVGGHCGWGLCDGLIEIWVITVMLVDCIVFVYWNAE